MVLYELFLGGRMVAELIDEVAEEAHRVAPAVARADAAELLRVMFLPRIQVTERCGASAACTDGLMPEWRGHEPQPTEVPVLLECDDIHDLPRIFGAALVDRLAVRDGRVELEQRLADVLVRALAPVTFRNSHCRRDRACREVPVLFLLAGDGHAR